ncbi:MAG: hypothetical protein WBL74_00625 [Novosphingobium sp.]
MIIEAFVTSDGRTLEVRGTWRPPSEKPIGRDNYAIAHVLLGVEYAEQAQPAGHVSIRPWSYRVSASVNPQFGQPAIVAQQQREIAAYRLDYQFDDAKPVRVLLTPEPPDPNWPGLGKASSKLPDPPQGTQRLTLTLSDRTGKVVSQSVYFVDETSDRQGTYLAGRKEALAMASDPGKCWPIKR